MAVDFVRENQFLYIGRNYVTISQTSEFIPVYLCLFVCNFAAKLAFGNRVGSKSMVSISSTLIFSPSLEIVPHLQRELAV